MTVVASWFSWYSMHCSTNLSWRAVDNNSVGVTIVDAAQGCPGVTHVLMILKVVRLRVNEHGDSDTTGDQRYLRCTQRDMSVHDNPIRHPAGSGHAAQAIEAAEQRGVVRCRTNDQSSHASPP